MTKKEIVKEITEHFARLDEEEARKNPGKSAAGKEKRSRVTQLLVKEIVQMVFDRIIDTLIAEGRIELRNFGVFEVKKRAARTARNPRTGEAVDVPEKYVVTFKPGKTMEQRVLALEEKELAERAAAADAAQPAAAAPDMPSHLGHPLTPSSERIAPESPVASDGTADIPLGHRNSP